jgi:Dolichyl-phosphate-mannose-protein mannosyltransferase
MGKTTMAIIWKSWVMKSRSLTGSLSVLAIFSVAFVVILASMSRSVNPYDEGIIATGATLVMAGEVMHRDFYANYGPAQFYILAILFKLFGPSILVARLWGALIKASIAVVVYLLGKRVMPTGWALVSCACSIVWLSLVENTVWPAWPALLATILSIFVLDTIFEKGSSFKRVFAAGMFVGIATLFRYDIGFIVCVAEAAVLLPFSFTVGTAGGQTRLRSVLVNLAAYCAGIAVVCMPVAAAFCFAGAIGDLLFDVVQFPARHYAATRSLPFPLPMPGRRPFYLSEYIVYFPLLMCLGVVFMAPFNRLHGSLAPRVATSAGDSRRGMWILLLLCAVTIGFFGKGLVRVSALHMTLAVVPATLILAAFLSANSHKKVSVGFAVFLGIAMVAGIIPTLNAYHTVTGKIANNLGHFSGRDRHDSAAQDAADTQVSCLPNPGLERIACFQLAIDHAAAVRYVQANTTVSDAIFVGLPQHERIFANNVGFYFVANRRPATKWYHFDPGLQTSQAIQELMISELLLSRPKFVVLDAEWEGWREPNESAKSSGVKLLDEFIDHHYVRVATFGSLSILQPLIADVPSR